MNDNRRSLPPLVNGIVYGHLRVTIDEVLWRNYPHDVVVLLKWWGERDSVYFRPTDVSKYPESARENESLTYNIKTNLLLFETYIKQCNKLKLLVLNDSTREIVGHVEIDNLIDLITGIQYKKYFPIVTCSGSRVGDLRVDFDLHFKSIPEDTPESMRKRSRRKNKSNNNSFRLPEEDGNKVKEIKKGYRTSSKHATADNALNIELPKSPNLKAPPNTGRSAPSDCDLLDVLEKGKKLRDAMVMTVLEDSDSELDKELLLKLDQVEKEDTNSYKPLKMHRNGEIITPREERLIQDYLDGKTLKEEEEVFVLNTLHGENKEENQEIKPIHTIPKEEEVLLSEKCAPHSASTDKSCTAPDSVACVDEDSSLLKKINCLRLTLDTLILTNAGWKKINQVDKKKKCDTVPPPGATYFVECHFVEESPRTQAQLWKTTPLRFCSRRQIGDVVYFGQSSAHVLNCPFSLENIQNELASTNCLVCWRHLNQRVPALLGHFSLAGVLQNPCLETIVSLPVKSESDGTVARVRLKLELGKDKLYFGKALFGGIHSSSQENQKSTAINKEDMIIRIKEIPLSLKEIEKSKPQEVKIKGDTKNNFIKSQTMSEDSGVTSGVPLCRNCGRNLVLSSFHSSVDSSLCVSCTNLFEQHPGPFVEPNFEICIPKHFDTKEQRYHEFLLGIDTIIGFPVFAGIQEEVSCYIDYRFPEVASGFKVGMSKSEVTSAVIECDLQPSFSSVHRHILPLPVVLPLSPLLVACSPGITLRLWLRYYKPTPRDHMVAMALLQMDELCSLEWEYDRMHQKVAVSKVLDLPLALVPSSVTAPYQHYHNLGVLRVSLTYSNNILATPLSDSKCEPVTVADSPVKTETTEEPNQEISARNIHTLPRSLPQTSFERKKDIKVGVQSVPMCNDKISEQNLRVIRNRFWTGPFGKEKCENQHIIDEESEAFQNKQSLSIDPMVIPSQGLPIQTNNQKLNSLNHVFFKDSDPKNKITQECSRPILKEDFDILAESLEQRFNQLQSNLMKEKEKALTEVEKIAMDTEKLNNEKRNDDADDNFMSFHSVSSNSSIESLPFILGPPADFKDVQNTVDFSTVIQPFSDPQCDKMLSDTISGYINVEKTHMNFSSNELFDKRMCKSERVKPKTFKAKIKIDRAVNLKAIKGPSNGRKCKVPPSSWVSFGTGDCCEQNCGTEGLVCTGLRFTTPVIRRNYNPIWNLAWDVDLPVDYLQQVNKRLVFRVFEENLDVAFGFASANLSILTSGLPCLSSWLSIDDLAGTCKGQIKVVVTPLEDVSQYQECSVFDHEEDDFEEIQEIKLDSSPLSPIEGMKPTLFIASQTEVFVNDVEGDTSKDLDEEVERFMVTPQNAEHRLEGGDPFSTDDVISDYKNTLENNFRNEMAGLENLIRFLRVGSMSNELSFLRGTENKENLSSNPTSQPPKPEIITAAASEEGRKFFSDSGTSVNIHTQKCPKEKMSKDASTDTMYKNDIPSSSNQSSEDILSKLLEQISFFQLPPIKITDNTCQTVTETAETFTETNACGAEINKTVHLKDASTETEDICNNRSSHKDSDHTSQSPHVCELGSALLQHFLTCKPAPIKVTDSSCQTTNHVPSVDSSGVYLSSGMSSGILKDNVCSSVDLLECMDDDWISTGAQTNNERLDAIDNNIKNLERFFKENITGNENILSADPVEGGSEGTSSDMESLECCSQDLCIPRKTRGGGNTSTVVDIQNPSNTDSMGTTLKRQGTFVIEKSKGDLEDPAE